MTVRELLAWGRHRLQSQPAGPLETEILVCHVLDVSRAWLFANPEQVLDSAPLKASQELIERRVNGEPVAYLTGKREFWSMPLRITPDVLIPRPETELLVEVVLEAIPPTANWRIADLGTGSGAIALALALERPGCEVHATEYSHAALALARENGRLFAPGRVRFHKGSWLAPLTGKFEVLVSNPPYVAASDPHLQRGDCRFEPADALTPGRDALAAIRHIADESRLYLQQGGLLAFEHGHDQGEALRQLMAELDYIDLQTYKDMESRERVTTGTFGE
jgi:release factor glutamine methyltransferase